MAALTRLPEWFNEAKGAPCPTSGGGTGAKREGFVDKSLRVIAAYIRDIAVAEDAAGQNGLLQSIDTRARIAGILFLIAACAATGNWFVLGSVALVCAALIYASGVSLTAFGRRVAAPVVFTAVIVAPVFFGVGGVGAAGGKAFATGAFIISRVAVMVSLSTVLALTTRQTDFFKGLAGLAVPSSFVTALFMTFRYVFILIKTVEDAAMARKSRVITGGRLGEPQAWFASRAALLLHKSLGVAGEVNMAMVSRGFRGGRIMTTGHALMRPRDYIWLGASSFALFVSIGL